MAPIACLLIPDFPLAALIRANPELRDRPAASSDGRGPHAPLSFVNALARSAGVMPGMTAAQGRAIASGLGVEPRSPASERSAMDALIDVAESFSPIVEEGEGGRVYLELGRRGGGADSGAGSDYRAVAAEIARRVRMVGMEAAVGIASGKEIAAMAARCGGVRVIEARREAEFLNWMPLDLLGLGQELEATLARWGIRRLGEMARLDPREAGSRLGAAGAGLVRLARGESCGRAPLMVRRRAEEFAEKVELEYGIEILEPLSFLMRGILERLAARLRLRGLAAGEMLLEFELADRSRDQRRVAIAAATLEVRSILALLILELEKSPPAAAVEAIRISINPRATRAMQSDMFLPPAPAPERLQTTLARIAALCGPDRAGTLHPRDSYRPEAVELKAFAPPPAAAESAAAAPAAINRLVIRAVRPAQEVEVMCERGRPRFVRGRNLCARVVSIAGPWRHQGEWWRRHGMPAAAFPTPAWNAASLATNSNEVSATPRRHGMPPFARDYYDLALADGGVYRMYRDLHDEKWFVDGVYD